MIANSAEVSPDLSVVTMLYRSEPYVLEFHRRMVAAAERLARPFEIVYVDDGSPDTSASLVQGLLPSDSRILLVRLSRNFGHHAAALAGIRHARGRQVFIIDVDLEEQPEWLGDFASEVDRTGADVVFGVSASRKGTPFKRYSGALFWRLFNALSETAVPANPCTVRLMSRQFVDALGTLPDRNLFLAGNYAWTGFKQVARRVEKSMRADRSSYTLSRLLGLFLDAITSFSSYPLRLIFLVGVAISLLSVAAGGLLVVWKLSAPATISLGWSSIMVSLWLLSGIIIAFLGVIGIYVSRVFTEVKGRPLYIVGSLERVGAPDGGRSPGG